MKIKVKISKWENVVKKYALNLYRENILREIFRESKLAGECREKRLQKNYFVKIGFGNIRSKSVFCFRNKIFRA